MPGGNADCRDMRMLRVNQFLRGAKPKLPPPYGTFKEAQRVRVSEAEHAQFDLG